MPSSPYYLYMEIVARNIFSYLKAGRLLHLITFLELTISFCLFYFGDIFSWLSEGNIPLKLTALSPVVGMPLFAQLDARSRYQNYKLVKDHLYMFGFQKRILKPFIKSRCQRDAARSAAGELGMTLKCKEYFKENGYKWYHLFPDAIFKKPSILSTRDFWVTTLFAETYHPKIDFEKKDIFISTKQQEVALSVVKL